MSPDSRTPEWTAPAPGHDHPLAQAVRKALPEIDPWTPQAIAAAVQGLSDRGAVPVHQTPALQLAERIEELLAAQARAVAVQEQLDELRALIGMAVPAVQTLWDTFAEPLQATLQKLLPEPPDTQPAAEPRATSSRILFGDPDHAYEELITVVGDVDRPGVWTATCAGCTWSQAGSKQWCSGSAYLHAGNAHVLNALNAPTDPEGHRG